MPNLLNPIMSDLSQKLGELSLGATDDQIAMLGAIYWFTIEFGLCKEGDNIKFFGASPGASFGEIYQIEKMIMNHRDKIYPLDIINNPLPTKILDQDVQQFYYTINSLQDLYRQIID